MKEKITSWIFKIYEKSKNGLAIIINLIVKLLSLIFKNIKKGLVWLFHPIQKFLVNFLSKFAIGRGILKIFKAIGNVIKKAYKYLSKYQVKKKFWGLVKLLSLIFKNIKKGLFWLLHPIKLLTLIFKNIIKGLVWLFHPIQKFLVNFLSKFAIGRGILKIFKAIGNVIKKVYKYLNKYQVKKKIWGLIFLLPWIIGFSLFFAKPFIESFIFSFHTVKPTEAGLKMNFVGFERYLYALTVHVDFFRVLLESLRDIFFNLWLILIFSLLMAVLLNTKFRGRTFARAVFFIPVIFNSAAIEAALGGGEALRSVMKESGLGITAVFDLNTYLLQANMATGLISFLVSSINRIYLIISYSGVQILIFLAGLQAIPFHLYEAAKIEGATQYEIFWKITLPMVSPLILTAAVYTIVSSFLRSPITAVMQTVYNNQDYGLYASMSWMYFTVSAILLIVVLGVLSKVVFYYDK